MVQVGPAADGDAVPVLGAGGATQEAGSTDSVTLRPVAAAPGSAVLDALLAPQAARPSPTGSRTSARFTGSRPA